MATAGMQTAIGARLAQLRQEAQPERLAVRGPRTEVNVGLAERWGGALVGSFLALWGLSLLLRRRSILGGLSLTALGSTLTYRGVTGHCVAYEKLGVRSQDAKVLSHPLSRRIHARYSVTIDRPAEELYAFWHDLSNLPRIMRNLESVQQLDEKRSRWVALAPRGRQVQWDAQTISDRPNKEIAWQSTDEAQVPNRGVVRFEPAPGGRGTVVSVSLEYQPPAGAIGAAIARLTGQEPSQQIRKDLHRFKQIMEAGEEPITAGQPRGRCA
jgi:uncharacterized membrane protein